MKASVAALGAVLAASAVSARAELTFDTSGKFADGWYVAPMFSYDVPDSKRCTDNGLGGAVNVGNRGPLVTFEFGVQYLQLPFDCTYTAGAQTLHENGDTRLLNTEISALAGPYTDIPVLRQVYGIAGIGAAHRSNQPKISSDGTTFLGDLGLGYLQPFTAWGWSATLRAEARYRYERVQPLRYNDVPAAFKDVIFNIGLQIPLFGSEAAATPPPAPEGVAVVPAGEGKPEPAPAPAEAPAPAPSVAPTAGEGDAGAVIETAKAGDKVVLHGVTFESGKATLTENAKTVLDTVAVQLTQRPELKVEIGGHTDNHGGKALNKKLSGRRAQAVLDYLVLKGVDAGRLTAKGYGADQPVDTNETNEGRERNRRVELKVLQ